MAYSRIQRKTPVKRFSASRRARSGQPGKCGIVRLYGPALEELRWERYSTDKGICRKCRVYTFWEPRFDGDPYAFDMAHIVSRGAGGSDTMENIETLCHKCHMDSHNCGGRPLPAKSAMEVEE